MERMCGLEPMRVAFYKEKDKHDKVPALRIPTPEYVRSYTKRGNLKVPIFTVWAYKILSVHGAKAEGGAEVRARFVVMWSRVSRDP